MTDQPLQAFAPPSSLGNLFPNVSVGGTVEIILYIIFVFWAVYTLVAVYHWLRYSHASLIAFPAIATHLFVSLCLMGYALSGAIPFL